MMNEGSRVGRVSQPVLPLTPAKARSVGPSAGLLEDADGGVVFVFGLATFGYASTDQAGRRLAAVQLVTTRIASVAEVASAFGVNTATLWRWTKAFTCGGVLALVAERRGPKGPSKLTEALAARIVELEQRQPRRRCRPRRSGSLLVGCGRAMRSRPRSRTSRPPATTSTMTRTGRAGMRAPSLTWWSSRHRCPARLSGSRPVSGTWSRLRC